VKALLTSSLGLVTLVAACASKPAADKPPVAVATASPLGAAGLPSKVGDCVRTKVTQVGFRLQGVPDSGTEISFANGLHQVAYQQKADADLSKPGDEVNLCLVSLPTDCPPGDERGKIYQATNSRTRKTWTMPDSEHACGGA
jgi:hypothetical protein